MIRLEYFERNDFPQLLEWLSDEELLINWSGSLFSYPLTESALEWYITDVNEVPHSEAYIYKAIETESGRTIGHISLGSISKKNRSGRISRVLINSADRGRGYCHQMVSAILKTGFEELSLHRISLGVYDVNRSAIKCYEHSGFKVEGIHRDVIQFKNNWWTLVEMAILDDEWRRLRKPE